MDLLHRQKLQSAESSKETLSTSMVLANPLYAAIGVATFLLLVLLVVITAWCVKSKGVKSASAGGYVAGRKSTVDGKGPPDLWINHPHGQHVRGTGRWLVLYLSQLYTDSGLLLLYH